MTEHIIYSLEEHPERDDRTTLQIAGPNGFFEAAGTPFSELSIDERRVPRDRLAHRVSLDYGQTALRFSLPGMRVRYVGNPGQRGAGAMKIISALEAAASEHGLQDPRISLGRVDRGLLSGPSFAVSFSPESSVASHVARDIQETMRRIAPQVGFNLRDYEIEQQFAADVTADKGMRIFTDGTKYAPLLTSASGESLDADGRVTVVEGARYGYDRNELKQLIALTGIISTLRPL